MLMIRAVISLMRHAADADDFATPYAVMMMLTLLCFAYAPRLRACFDAAAAYLFRHAVGFR